MRALVTGAAGFIGSNLVDRLLNDGHQVVGVDNLSSGSATNLVDAQAHSTSFRRSFSLIKADIRSPELADIVAGTNPDVIFHLAAQVDVRVSVTHPELDARTNILGTINLCDAARRAGVRRVVYAASGGSRYGEPSSLPVDEAAPLKPLSPYGVAKASAELYLQAFAQMYGLAPICLALANVYGPRQNPAGEAGVVAVFGSAILAGRAVTIYGDGSAARDFVYVDDVVDAFVKAAAAPLHLCGTYNIGTASQTTVNDVYRMIAMAVHGAETPIYAAARTGELQAIALDSHKAQSELGWQASTDIRCGIERTVDWLRSILAPKSPVLSTA